MPVWIQLILWNVVLPDLILWLRHMGYIDAAEALTLRTTADVVRTVRSIKTYDEYPTGKNGA